MGILDILGGMAGAKVQLAMDERKRKLDQQQAAVKALLGAALEGKREFFADPSLTKPFGLSPESHEQFSKIAEAAYFGRKARLAELEGFGEPQAAPTSQAPPPPTPITEMTPEQEISQYVRERAPEAPAPSRAAPRAAAPPTEPGRRDIDPLAEARRIFEEAQIGTPSTSKTLTLKEGDVSLSRTTGVPGTAPSPTAQLSALERMRETEARQADQGFASEWLQTNPHIANAFPALATGIKAGAPQAMALAQTLMKDPTVIPPPEQQVALLKMESYPERRDMAIRLFGSAEKAAGFLAKHPVPGTIDPAKLERDYASEAELIRGEKKMPYIDAETARQAQKNVLLREADVREQTTSMQLKKWTELSERKAALGERARVAFDVVKNVDSDTRFITLARGAFKNIEDITDRLIAAGRVNTRILNLPFDQALAAAQLGDRGTAAALLRGWTADLAVLEQRLLGAGARMAEARTAKIESALPAVGDTTRVILEKRARTKKLLDVADAANRANIDFSVTLLQGDPAFKKLAVDMRNGLYGLVQSNLTAAQTPIEEPAPFINLDPSKLEKRR